MDIPEMQIEVISMEESRRREQKEFEEAQSNPQVIVMSNNIAYCKQCNTELTAFKGESRTLVGYYHKGGHSHDDNCAVRGFECPSCKKYWRLSVIRRCNDDGPKKAECEWTGKTHCFCHYGIKFDRWPDNIPVKRESIIP